MNCSQSKLRSWLSKTNLLYFTVYSQLRPIALYSSSNASEPIAAFNSVDFCVFLCILHDYIHSHSTALRWFTPYITCKTLLALLDGLHSLVWVATWFHLTPSDFIFPYLHMLPLKTSVISTVPVTLLCR